MEKLISIIVPVYNAEKFLGQTLDSILNQTYKNFELILVNDGSTDDSGKLCDDYAAKDRRVRVFHSKNGGISIAQNKGLDESRGDYLTFCDNDDLYHPQYLEILSRALNESQADIAKGRWQRPGLTETKGLKFETYNFSSANLTVFDRPFEKYQTVFSKLFRKLQKTEALYFNESNWCKLYRRELFENVRFPEHRFAQDVALIGPVLSQAKKVVDVDLVLYYWVQHSDSVTHNRENFQFLADNLQAGIENYHLAIEAGIPPYRNYYLLAGVINDISQLDERHPELIQEIKRDYLKKMPHRARAILLYRTRLLENFFYDRIYHRKK